MELSKAVKFVNKQIEQLEQAAYIFETVVKPRAEIDKGILDGLKTQLLKLQSLQDKAKRGEEVTVAEIEDCVPSSFR